MNYGTCWQTRYTSRRSQNISPAGDVSHKEVGNEGYAIWVLPTGTRMRALRFSHSPSPGDREMAGRLGGVWVTEARLANVAPQALPQSVVREDVSVRLVDESHNRTWATWSNGEQGERILPARLGTDRAASS